MLQLAFSSCYGINQGYYTFPSTLITRLPDVVPCSNSTLCFPSGRDTVHVPTRSPDIFKPAKYMVLNYCNKNFAAGSKSLVCALSQKRAKPEMYQKFMQGCCHYQCQKSITILILVNAGIFLAQNIGGP